MEIKINDETFEINESQKKELIKLLNEMKKKERDGYYITEDYSQLPPIIQIIVAGFVWEIGKGTYKNYKEMILDIIKNKK